MIPMMLTEDEVDEAAGIFEVPATSPDLSPELVSSPKVYPSNEQSRTPCSSFSMTEDTVSEIEACGWFSKWHSYPKPNSGI